MLDKLADPLVHLVKAAVGSRDDVVSLQPGVGHLAAHISVGDPHNKPVLRCIVLILVLAHQTLPGEVVGLSLPAPPELDLVSLEVGLVLDNLDERHLYSLQRDKSLVEVNQAILAWSVGL